MSIACSMTYSSIFLFSTSSILTTAHQSKFKKASCNAQYCSYQTYDDALNDSLFNATIIQRFYIVPIKVAVQTSVKLRHCTSSHAFWYDSNQLLKNRHFKPWPKTFIDGLGADAATVAQLGILLSSNFM